MVGEDDIQDLLHPQRFAWSAPLFDGLLEALFAWRATSLGAVVVRGDGLITYRQAFLPFATEREAVTPSTWGTRHLTALTLTERCDAIAVVTSEQSGDVTVFEGDAWTTTDFPKLDDEPSWNDMQARVYETILDAWRRRGS
ncbi:MAG: DNA integrity scanning protein DisA nucleotide-binding domain protein [Myxococcales bacterium]|nr:DNA integrity scanning protein DisA nucleotide-binding domain protein [Myxococcales bacterium]